MRGIKEEAESAGECEEQNAEEKPDVKLVKEERKEACEVENKQQELLNSVTEQASISCLKTDKSSSDQTAEDPPALLHSGDVSSLTPLESLTGEESSDERLDKHLQTHTRTKKHKCPRCDKSFTVPSLLKVHMRVHTREKPFCCSQCGKRLHRKTGLFEHMKIHTGEKPFSCSQCGRRFAQKSHWITHVRTHTGEKPFPCSLCGRRFTRRDQLTYHMGTHPREKLFSCPGCGKCFLQKADLKVHARSHAGERSALLLSLWEEFLSEVKTEDQDSQRCKVENKQQELLNTVTEQASLSRLKTEDVWSEETTNAHR